MTSSAISIRARERWSRAGRAALRIGLALLLISPYLIWMARITHWDAPDFASWGALLVRSVGQAVASTIVSAGAGWILFRALRALPPNARARGEWRLILPNAVPSLFLSMALIGLVTPFAAFPYGLGALVAAHALTHAGLIAVALERIERARLGAMAEAAWVMGVSERHFWIRVAAPVVRADLAAVLFFTFTLCLTSFALPLLLQGRRDATIEVAIYDLIRVDGRWDQAVLLAAAQTIALLGLTLILPLTAGVPRTPEPRALPYRPARAWGWLTWIPVGVLATGLGATVVPAVVRAIIRADIDFATLGPAALNTAALGAGVGFAHLILFMVIAFLWPHPRLERFLLGYLAPGPAITGFALLLAWPGAAGETAQLLRLTAALTLLSLAPLYRWQVHASLDALRGQVAVARTLGAGSLRIFTDVTWPQAGTAILTAVALSATWAAGDFAVSGLLLDRASTIPRLIVEHLEHYEWDRARVLLVPLAGTSWLLYSFYRGLARHVRD